MRGKLFLPFTLAPGGVVPAGSAFSGVGVTQVGVAVALTGAAAGEAPLARLAVGALSSHGSVFAPALARGWVAPLVQGALWVAVAGWQEEHTLHLSDSHVIRK